jgi:hypothetical protein
MPTTPYLSAFQFQAPYFAQNSNQHWCEDRSFYITPTQRNYTVGKLDWRNVKLQLKLTGATSTCNKRFAMTRGKRLAAISISHLQPIRITCGSAEHACLQVPTPISSPQALKQTYLNQAFPQASSINPFGQKTKRHDGDVFLTVDGMGWEV